MKGKIFMYLFIFSVLFILFQYVNSKKYFESESKKLAAAETEIKTLKDSIQSVLVQNADLQYFTLENNEDALSYYDNLNIENLSAYIQDKLIETNEQKGDNPLVPYAGMNGPMKINKIQVLNHKWIIADFSDGKYWGELFINYEIKPDLSIDFTRTSHFLYPIPQ